MNYAIAFDYLIIAEFFVAAVLWALQANWPKALYWAGAFVLNVAVIWGMPHG